MIASTCAALTSSACDRSSGAASTDRLPLTWTMDARRRSASSRPMLRATSATSLTARWSLRSSSAFPNWRSRSMSATLRSLWVDRMWAMLAAMKLAPLPPLQAMKASTSPCAAAGAGARLCATRRTAACRAVAFRAGGRTSRTPICIARRRNAGDCSAEMTIVSSSGWTWARTPSASSSPASAPSTTSSEGRLPLMNGGRVFTVPVTVLMSRAPPVSRMSWATCSARVALAETTLIFILWTAMSLADWIGHAAEGALHALARQRRGERRHQYRQRRERDIGLQRRGGRDADGGELACLDSAARRRVGDDDVGVRDDREELAHPRADDVARRHVRVAHHRHAGAETRDLGRRIPVEHQPA